MKNNFTASDDGCYILNLKSEIGYLKERNADIITTLVSVLPVAVPLRQMMKKQRRQSNTVIFRKYINILKEEIYGTENWQIHEIREKNNYHSQFTFFFSDMPDPGNRMAVRCRV